LTKLDLKELELHKNDYHQQVCSARTGLEARAQPKENSYKK
jgi:hypothetical protein